MYVGHLKNVHLVELDELDAFIERSYATAYDTWRALGFPGDDTCLLFDVTRPRLSDAEAERITAWVRDGAPLPSPTDLLNSLALRGLLEPGYYLVRA